MSSTIEQAKEGLEHAHHASEHGDTGGSHRNVAVLIAVLAACLALSEMGEKAAQNSYLTHHISVSDTYGFMQAKNARRAVYSSAAEVIESMPVVDEAARKRLDRLRSDAARMADEPSTGDGAKQLLEKARGLEHERDHAFHVYHLFEMSTGALQISIVLASVSIVTRIRALTWMAGLIGCGAAVFAGLIAAGVV
jgi:hypothetical protein